MMLRVLNEYFTKKTGQPFVITNVSGVSGYEQTYQAVPDGYNFIAGLQLFCKRTGWHL